MLILTDTSITSLLQAAECVRQHVDTFKKLLEIPDVLPEGLTVFDHELLPVEVVDLHRGLLLDSKGLTRFVKEFLADPAIPELVVLADLFTPSEQDPFKKLLKQIDKGAVKGSGEESAGRTVQVTWYCTSPERIINKYTSSLSNIRVHENTHISQRFEGGWEEKNSAVMDLTEGGLAEHACTNPEDNDALQQLVIDLARMPEKEVNHE
jgi:hypothetical protein